MDTIEVYFEADMTKLLDKKDAPKSKSTKKYIRCNLNDTLLQILKHPNYVVPQFPVFKIISRENDDFKESFLNEIWISRIDLIELKIIIIYFFTKWLNNYLYFEVK